MRVVGLFFGSIVVEGGSGWGRVWNLVVVQIQYMQVIVIPGSNNIKTEGSGSKSEWSVYLDSGRDTPDLPECVVEPPKNNNLVLVQDL